MEPKKELISINDFISGSIAGIVQVLLGQPLDMIKVRMQTQQGGQSSLLSVAKNIYHNEGALAFYKGTLSPLIGISFCVAIQFGGNETAKNYFMEKNRKTKGKSELNVKQFALSGMFAGFFNAFAISPVELFRIKMQVQGRQLTDPNAIKTNYTGTIDCAKNVFNQFGLKGVFQGLNSTIIREVPAFGVYFGVYESLIKFDLKKYKERQNLPLLHIMTFGALAGIFLWLATFPMDLIKSRIQSDNLSKPIYPNYLSTVKIIYSENGLSGFYKGLSPCLVRAPPINAATFLTFELVSSFLKKERK